MCSATTRRPPESAPPDVALVGHHPGVGRQPVKHPVVPQHGQVVGPPGGRPADRGDPPGWGQTTWFLIACRLIVPE